MASTSTQDTKWKALTIQDVLCLVSLAGGLLYYIFRKMVVLTPQIATPSPVESWRLCSSRAVSIASARHRQVVKQGLGPDMALWACNNPKINGSALSRAIIRLVDEHAKAAVDRPKTEGGRGRGARVIRTGRRESEGSGRREGQAGPV